MDRDCSAVGALSLVLASWSASVLWCWCSCRSLQCKPELPLVVGRVPDAGCAADHTPAFRLCRRLYKSDCSLQASLHSLAPSLLSQPSLGARELIGKEPEMRADPTGAGAPRIKARSSRHGSTAASMWGVNCTLNSKCRAEFTFQMDAMRFHLKRSGSRRGLESSCRWPQHPLRHRHLEPERLPAPSLETCDVLLRQQWLH